MAENGPSTVCAGAKSVVGPTVVKGFPADAVTLMSGVVGFYFPGRYELIDRLCKFPSGGNFWQLSSPLTIKAPPQYTGSPDMQFTNAEAAFQAFKDWKNVHKYTGATAEEAFDIKMQVPNPDRTYGGHGSNWAAMMVVLKVKFSKATHASKACRHNLLTTGDSYLLEHNLMEGWDNLWSNNYDGSGANWLGLQLMLIRDDIRVEDGFRRSSNVTWTRFLVDDLQLSRETGQWGSDESKQTWQESVRLATVAVANEVKNQGIHLCKNPKCGRLARNNQLGDVCEDPECE